jgi:hypothetical protein
MTISSSYRAPSSGRSSVKSPPRSWSSSHDLVLASAGKMPAVAPSSWIMLQIVARSVTVSVSTPGPSKANALPKPPFTVRRRSISRMTSLADTHPRSRFSRTTRTILG